MREARACVRLSQTALADALGIEQTVVSRYERGAVVPHVDTAIRIAAALQVSTDWLLTGEGRGPASEAA
jgi:transcriptional regulator with XRE-family HTH domain